MDTLGGINNINIYITIRSDFTRVSFIKCYVSWKSSSCHDIFWLFEGKHTGQLSPVYGISSIFNVIAIKIMTFMQPSVALCNAFNLRGSWRLLIAITLSQQCENCRCPDWMSLVKLHWKIFPSELVKNIITNSKNHFFNFRYFSSILSKILDSDYHQQNRIFKKVLKVSKLSFHWFLSVAAKRL